MAFDVIIHSPKEKGAQQELEKEVAAVHAQAVMEMVKSITLPVEQKIRLINAVKEYIPK